MNSPKVNEKLSRSQSTKKMVLSPSGSQERIDDEESSSAQVTERAKSDRMAATKQDEDRRRRTIIVEKKNGSFGFTLQSYGIHYKKEQEIEMITYVDYVEYDGPAFKAGMREGDVILSINGHDMEKADHKALVNFIKNCDTRMRMVVLFEDCVRKVELHIRYIQLQRILQSKTEELDKLCAKERELLQGKWKSHSLPARKKGNSATQCQINSPCQEEPYCRPTVSIEDVTQVPNQSQLLLAHQYLDPRYQYVIRSDSSNKLLLSWNQDSQDCEPIMLTPNCDNKQKQCRYKNYYETNGIFSSEGRKTRHEGKTKSSQHHSKHLCTSCMQTVNSQDNTSVEAYDLASPCCDPHCVPSAKRKLKHQKHKHQSKSHDQSSSKENEKSGSSKLKNREGKEKISKVGSQQRSNKYFNFGSNLVSQFSLHSCTSSDISNSVEVAGSGASYTTSLSSDTLFWDNSDGKSCSKPHSYSRTSSYKCRPTSTDSYQSLQSAKPKSWDNLTKKAFGGYGFGYDYIDACGPSKSQSYSSNCTSLSNTMPAKMKPNSKNNGVKVNLNQINFKSKSGGRVHSIQIYHNGHHHCIPPTKSSESLLLQKQTPVLTNSSLSCECLDIGSPLSDNNAQKFFPYRSSEVSYCHQEKASQASAKHRQNREPPVGTVSRL